MSGCAFNKTDVIKLYTSCSTEQTIGISEDYMKGLLCKIGALTMCRQKNFKCNSAQCLSLKTQHTSRKGRISVPSICRSEAVNGSHKAELCGHQDNGVFPPATEAAISKAVAATLAGVPHGAVGGYG